MPWSLSRRSILCICIPALLVVLNLQLFNGYNQQQWWSFVLESYQEGNVLHGNASGSVLYGADPLRVDASDVLVSENTDAAAPASLIESTQSDSRGGFTSDGSKDVTSVHDMPQVLDEEVFLSQRRSVAAVVFPQWPNSTLPCFPPQGNATTVDWSNRRSFRQPTQEGLFYLKLCKTASSTSAGVHLRIARNEAVRQESQYEICRTRHLHGSAGRQYRYGARNRKQSLLWTTVREPTRRYMSEFFHFEYARKGIEPSDENIINFLRHGKHSDRHYLAWLTPGGFRAGKPYWMANRIMKEYDFIGLVERYDETLVCLMMLWNLKMADILYLSAKSNGGYDDGGYNNKCYLIEPSFVSPGVQAFLDSSEWREYVNPELAVFEAANRSLDLTIDSLGRQVFEEKLALFRRSQEVVQERCTPDRVIFPCSPEGVRRPDEEADCLMGDSGCGFECLDEVASALDLW